MRRIRRTGRQAAQAAPEPGSDHMILSDLNSIEGALNRRPGDSGPGTEPRTGATTEQPRETAEGKKMTTNWKRLDTAGCAGAEAPCAAACISSVPVVLVSRTLRWRRDAACEYAWGDAGLQDAESASSGIMETFFNTSRIQTQPTTRKETLNTTQEKKGKQTKSNNQTRNKLVNLA